MPKPASQVTKLKQLIRLAQELLNEAEGTSSDKIKGASGGQRKRRSGKELVAFRKMLKAERKKGIPVAQLAKQHGISSAYIYGLD
jgi:predicted nucleic-acid-binding protein